MTSERDELSDAEPSRTARRGLRGRRTQMLLVLVAVGLTLVVGLAAIARLPLGRPSSDVEPRIAILDSSGALATMDAQGTSIVALGLDGVALPFPAYSPDGSRLAVLVQDNGGTRIEVVDARPEHAIDPRPTVVYRSQDEPPFYLYWTPDGTHLTFLTQELDGLALRAAPADASTPDVVVRRGAPMYWALPDSLRLLVHSGGSGSGAFLGEQARDGAADARSIVAPGRFQAPAVSPDGHVRAYVSAGDGSAQVVLETRDGQNRRAVPINDPAAISFDPGGTTVAVIESAESTAFAELAIGPLRAIDAGSGAVRTLLDGFVLAFFWSPDGATIAALRLIGPGGGGVASAVADLGVTLQLVLVDADTGTTRSERSVELVELYVRQFLPYFDQYALSHRIWAPDSADIALPLIGDDGIARLYVVPADGSDARAIAEGVFGVWSP